MKSGLKLREGENVIVELEAELWATSSNPIARFIGEIIRIINLILGTKKYGYLVITDQRVVEVMDTKACWFFDMFKQIKYVLPSSVKEVGYIKESTFLCFCKAYHLYYDSHTQRTSILLKGADEIEAQKIVDAFFNTISKANATVND